MLVEPSPVIIGVSALEGPREAAELGLRTVYGHDRQNTAKHCYGPTVTFMS
jgi:hypothetical protein